MFSLDRLKHRRQSYSQCGEDLIVNFIKEALRLKEFRYLDIGANDPYKLNNTALFYLQGHSGVLVEADPVLASRLKRARKKDLCLNIGVGAKECHQADFYLMSSPTLNTFSKSEALKFASYGNEKIVSTVKVDILSINTVLEQNFTKAPNFISLDVEGLDLEILSSFDFQKYAPEIFCVETLTYTEDKSERKIPEISSIMAANGYMVFSDTYINTIYVKESCWRQR